MREFAYMPLILIALLMMGCGGKSTSTNSPEEGVQNPSFSTDIQPILNANCTGCHGSSSPSGGYPQTSYGGIMGNGSDSVPNVIAGKPSESRLYQRIEKGEMPPGGHLASKDIATIRNWIEQGAKNN